MWSWWGGGAPSDHCWSALFRGSEAEWGVQCDYIYQAEEKGAELLCALPKLRYVLKCELILKLPQCKQKQEKQSCYYKMILKYGDRK